MHQRSPRRPRTRRGLASTFEAACFGERPVLDVLRESNWDGSCDSKLPEIANCGNVFGMKLHASTFAGFYRDQPIHVRF
jgi:hypothetical protein